MNIGDIVLWEIGCIFMRVVAVNDDNISGIPFALLFNTEIVKTSKHHEKQITLKEKYLTRIDEKIIQEKKFKNSKLLH